MCIYNGMSIYDISQCKDLATGNPTELLYSKFCFPKVVIWNQFYNGVFINHSLHIPVCIVEYHLK